jgi:outer membrane protein TolC
MVITGCLALNIVRQPVQGQQRREITLTEVKQKAEAHYPLTRQKGIIKQTETLTLMNLNKGYLPQLSMNGQATYQSEVTQIAVPVPELQIAPLSKDQYRITADLTQNLFDGGAINAQKNVQQLNAKVEEQKLEVELYRLRERMNQLYLNILLLEKQTEQANLVIADILTGLRKTEAQVKNGVAFRSSLDGLNAERLRAEQRVLELQAMRTSYLQTLSLFIAEPLDSITTFLTPLVPEIAPEIKRPELNLYQEQSGLLERQKKLVATKYLPKVSLFGQGGYGRPGLNFLQNDFRFYYLAGIRLNFNVSGYYTYRREKSLLDLNQHAIGLQRETFLLNTNSQLTQQQAEIQKLQRLIQSDQKIIALRESVKKAAQAQLANQVITTNDYLREVNAEDQARQALILHQLQLLQAQINYQTIAGN